MNIANIGSGDDKVISPDTLTDAAGKNGSDGVSEGAADAGTEGPDVHGGGR
jgi:hypothetical protein